MLRAYSEYFSELVHIIENAEIEDCRRALSCLDESGEHGDGCGLASTVVAEQRKYLSGVHGDVRVVNCDFLAELPPETPDLETLFGLFLSFNCFGDGFKIFWVCLQYLIFLV